MNLHPRFTLESGREVFAGHELVIRGALESRGGFGLLTGCRRNPVAGLFDTCDGIGELLEQFGVQVRATEHPADASAILSGSMLMNQRAMLALTVEGMHIASDSLARGMFTNIQNDAAAVIVCSDQRVGPASNAQADMRFLAEHLRMPLIEPTCGQEVKDWVDAAFQLSQAGGIYVGYLLADTLLDGGASVDLNPWGFERECTLGLGADEDVSHAQQNKSHYGLPDKRRDRLTRQRHNAVIIEAQKLGVNQVYHRPQKGEIAPLGFIASGMGYSYLTHVLDIMGLRGRFPICKLGLSYPLDSVSVTNFAKHCDNLVVIEEGRRFLERQVVEILQPLQQSDQLKTAVWGQAFPDDIPGIPSHKALHPSLLIDRLSALFEKIPTNIPEAIRIRIAREKRLIEQANQRTINIPDRSPTFCPGCPQRDVSMVVRDLKNDFRDAHYMRRTHKLPPFELVVHGDDGCNTMMSSPPHNDAVQSFAGAGLGAATSAGVGLFSNDRQVVFMGDQSFLSTGQLAVRRSIEQQQDITYVIMENKTSPPSVLRRFWATQDGSPVTEADRIEEIIKQMTPKKSAVDVRVARTRMEDYHSFREAMEESILAEGIKVVVCDKVCGVTFHQHKSNATAAEVATHGFQHYTKFQNVALDVCEFCLECTNQTGCPGLTLVNTYYGPKVQTDLNWCTNDQACSRLEVCPAFEQVIVTRNQPEYRPDAQSHTMRSIPAPRPKHADSDTWRCQIAGVAGMGIGLATQVLIAAGRAMGYNIRFVEDKGRAIGSGGVFSQIFFTRDDRASSISPIIPYGKADLLLGIDPLEALRTMDPRHRYRVVGEQTSVVMNSMITPTILSMINLEQLSYEEYEKLIRDVVPKENYIGLNVSDVCDRLLGKRTYLNMITLGIAYQSGFIPITLDAIEGAISETFGVETDANLRAFRIGRSLSENPDAFQYNTIKENETPQRTYRRLYHAFRTWDRRKIGRSKVRASAFRQIAKRAIEAFTKRHVSQEIQNDFITRLFDCVIWGGARYAKRYLRAVMRVMEEDSASNHFVLTREVIHSLAHVMLIKDEIFVSSLLTNPLKIRRDKKRFNVNSSRGDRIKYKRIVKPEFVLFKQRFGFEISSRPWMLKCVANMKWLRRIMPGWHKEDKEFRSWFRKILAQVKWENQTQYDQWVEILSQIRTVTGYRKIRSPKIAHVRETVTQLIDQLNNPSDPGDPGNPNAHSSTGNNQDKIKIAVSLSDKLIAQ